VNLKYIYIYIYIYIYYYHRRKTIKIKKKRLKNIKTWTKKLNIIIIINIIQFINIIKIKINIITIEKNIDLILMVKPIIIVSIPFQTQETWVWKGVSHLSCLDITEA
jgi:hypothetical protein